MAHYDSDGNWVLDVGDDPNNPPAPPTKAGDWVSGDTGMAQVSGAPTYDWTKPADFQGNYWDYINHLSDTGMINAPAPSQGGLLDFVQEHGYVVPLALMGGVAAAGEAGIGAAGAASGEAASSAPAYTGMSDYMAQAGLGADTGFTPTYASMGDYMSQAGLDAGTFNGSNFQMPSTLSAKDVITNANRLKSIASLLNAGGKTSGTSANPQQLGTLLAGGTPQSSNFIGQIKANQNPFIFTPAGQTVASEGMYDVSGSNMAKALRNA